MSSLQETLNICVHLLDQFKTDEDVGEELLSFFLAVFNVLRGQIKKEFIEQVIGIILMVFASYSMQSTSNTSHIINNRSKILENLLKLLTFVVQQPVYSYKPQASSLIPGILALVLNQISPLVTIEDQANATHNQNPISDPGVVSSLFDFYYELLNNNFKYFFGSKAVTSLNGPLVDHEGEFVKIMESYGRSFLSSKTDIQVYRKNLNSLLVLHQKFGLFEKDYFRRNLLKEFLTLFLRTFVCKSHELFHDELINIIYLLASIDMNSFHTCFLPEFVTNILTNNTTANNSLQLANNILQVKESFSTSKDLPSFSLNLQKFSTDLRFCRMS
jgi:hypothetical protein